MKVASRFGLKLRNCKKTVFYLLAVLVVTFYSAAMPVAIVFAANISGGSQKAIFTLGIPYYNLKVDNSCATGGATGSVAGSSTTGSEGTSSGDYSAEQVQLFASQSITSTWGISDETAEQWFLQQAGAQSAITKYGLNESNISEITAAVKGAGVSPVFFYAYTVNEGGGAGGFINHFVAGAMSGVAVPDATKDAEYLASQSQIMDSTPAWIDAGNPVNFVPQDVQDSGNASFQSMPAGTIGRAYIPATAATTWEVYYPDGLKAEFNQVQDYGHPLTDMMNSILAMGGNPLDGSLTTSCTGVVAGEGMQKGIEWAKFIANNDGYGYDQATRTSGWEKYQSDSGCESNCGSFDCSSFVSAILTVAGYYDENPNWATTSAAESLSSHGFEMVANNVSSADDLQAGDVLLNPEHVEMYIGDGQNVGASQNESGGINGGATGDQTGSEIAIIPFYGTWGEVWRAQK